ncbi:chorismate synthase isoform X1 [Wolffia australiana]
MASANCTDAISHDHPSRVAPLLSYNRDFLLSLRDKEICKKLPTGFDLSLLSEIEEAASHPPEWQRGTASSSVHASRRSEFGSSSYGRVDGSSGYSRGANSRWDTRSSASSDKDGSAAVEHDYGRRSAVQHRRLGQKPEQDGLLGSGVFPRSSGHHQGWSSALKDKGDSHYQLDKTNEPYQPPRPQKSGPYSRKDVTDTCNDETFGSSECSDQKRQDEERMRRESFELMRKEQRKVLQGMQKNVPGMHAENDISSLLVGCQIDSVLESRNDEKLESNVSHLVSKGECPNLSSIGSNAPPRPLVPPGFASASTETCISKQLHKSSLSSKVDNSGNDDSSHLASNHPIVNGKEYTLNLKDKFDSSDPNSLSSNLGFFDHSYCAERPACDASVPFDSKKRESILCRDSTESKTTVPEGLDTSRQVTSALIMEKLFGHDFEKDGGAQAPKSSIPDETLWTAPLSSKFESWFLEHNKPEDSSQDSSRVILSLIVGTEKDESGSAPFSVENLPDSFGISETYHRSSAGSSMLTCEDLEQSILAEVEGTSSLDGGTVNPNGELPRADVDNEASEHLLTLLQKGPTQSKEDYLVIEDMKYGDSSLGSLCSNLPDEPGKPLTLEALFGSAFMQELHSMDAPVSGLRPKVDGTLPGDTTVSSEFPIKLDLSLHDSFISPDGSGRKDPPREIDDVIRHRPEALTFSAMDQSERSSSSSSASQVAWPDVSHHRLHAQPLLSRLHFSHSNQEMTSGYPYQLEHSTSHHHDPLHQFLSNPDLHLQQRFDPRFHLQMSPQAMPMPRGFAQHPLQYFPRGGPLPHAVASSHLEAMHHALPGHHNQMIYGMRMPGMMAMDPSGRQMEAEAQLHQHHHHHHLHQQLNSHAAHLSGAGQARFFNPELSSAPRNR